MAASRRPSRRTCCLKVVALSADLGPHASKGDSGQPYPGPRRNSPADVAATAPPTSVERRIRGLAEAPVPPAPGFPLCAMGFPRDGAALVSKEVEPGAWREFKFEMGRRRYVAQFSAAWHSLFEMFVPIDRTLGPAYRPLLRERTTALRTAHAVEIGP